MNQGAVYANSSSLPCYYPLDPLPRRNKAPHSLIPNTLECYSRTNPLSLFLSRYSCIESLNRLDVCHRCVVLLIVSTSFHRSVDPPSQREQPRTAGIDSSFAILK